MTFKPNRVAVKFYTTAETTIQLANTVAVLQRWIQEHTVEGLLIDVVDYKHVPNGPGVVLIGHEADYSIDQKDGQIGLLYTLKREPAAVDFTAQLTISLRRAVNAVKQLAQEKALHEPQFVTSTFELRILDRLAAPNTPSGFEFVENSVQEIFAGLGIEVTTLEHVANDERDVLTLKIALTQDLATVGEKLTIAPVPA